MNRLGIPSPEAAAAARDRDFRLVFVHRAARCATVAGPLLGVIDALSLGFDWTAAVAHALVTVAAATVLASLRRDGTDAAVDRLAVITSLALGLALAILAWRGGGGSKTLMLWYLPIATFLFTVLDVKKAWWPVAVGLGLFALAPHLPMPLIPRRGDDTLPLLDLLGSVFCTTYITAIAFRERKRQIELLLERERQVLMMGRRGALGDIAAGVAHEINNPLTVILGQAQMLQRLIARGPVEEERHIASWKQVEGMARRVHTIVRSLRLYSGERDVGGAEPIDLEPMMAGLFDLFKARASRAGVTLSVHAAPGSIVLGRRGELGQAIMQLLSNALTAVGSVETRHIGVVIARAGGRVLLAVEDTGPGVPAELCDRLFEPFISSRPPGNEPVGLGLSVAQGTIHTMGGDLRYERDGGVSRFVIDLPVAS